MWNGNKPWARMIRSRENRKEDKTKKRFHHMFYWPGIWDQAFISEPQSEIFTSKEGLDQLSKAPENILGGSFIIANLKPSTGD